MTRIDLHLHTTASDGRCSPLELVEQATAAGLSVMAVTDHDTTAAIDEVRARAAERGIDAIASARTAALVDPEGESLAKALAAIERQVALPMAAE